MSLDGRVAVVGSRLYLRRDGPLCHRVLPLVCSNEPDSNPRRRWFCAFEFAAQTEAAKNDSAEESQKVGQSSAAISEWLVCSGRKQRGNYILDLISLSVNDPIFVHVSCSVSINKV